MHIDPANASAPQFLVADKVQGLLVGCSDYARQFTECVQNHFPMLQIAARQFSQHGGMHKYSSVGEQRGQSGVVLTEVSDPDGRVDKNHSVVLEPAPGNGLQCRLRSTQCGETPSRFTGNESLKAGVDQGSLFLDSGKFARIFEKRIVDD